MAIAVVMFAQISNINTPMIGSSDTFVWNADIPNLILAAKIWKPFSAIFAIIVFAGIYTTAVPLLYNPASRFAKRGNITVQDSHYCSWSSRFNCRIIPSIQSIG